jgi:transcriptional regulator with XRE-family HTH domain
MITLGQKLRTLRDAADLSLRELATKADVSAPFLSDIELGRRLPSPDVIERLAKVLSVDPEELRKHDLRDLKRDIDADPAMGFAFRTASEQIKAGNITPQQLVELLKKSAKRKK